MGFYFPIQYPIPLLRGGLGADVSSYNGLVSIVGGASFQTVIGAGLNFDLPSHTLSAAGNALLQKVQADVDGVSVGQRKELNFISGSGLQITGIDNNGADRVDITFQSTGPSSLAPNAQIIRALESPKENPDGSTVTFTFTKTIVNGQEHLYVGGVLQDASTYSVAANTIVFNSAPQPGVQILLDYWSTPPTASAQRIVRENNGWVPNGSTTDFATVNTIQANSERVWVNGIYQTPTTNYTVVGGGATIRFSAGHTPQTGDKIRVTYWASNVAPSLATVYSTFQETPGGAVNGSNKAFTLTNAPSVLTTHIYVNGILKSPFLDFSQSGSTITFVQAPQAGATILAYYDTGIAGTAQFSTTPTGAVNGVNGTYTLPVTPTSLAVYVNGARINPTRVSTSGANFTLTAPVPQPGDWITADYTS